MKTLLDRYVGKEIGSNARKPYHLDPYILVAVQDTWFTLAQTDDSTQVHIPYENIVRVLENSEQKIHVGGLFQHKHDFNLIIKVGHVVTQVPG